MKWLCFSFPCGGVFHGTWQNDPESGVGKRHEPHLCCRKWKKEETHLRIFLFTKILAHCFASTLKIVVKLSFYLPSSLIWFERTSRIVFYGSAESCFVLLVLSSCVVFLSLLPPFVCFPALFASTCVAWVNPSLCVTPVFLTFLFVSSSACLSCSPEPVSYSCFPLVCLV